MVAQANPVIRPPIRIIDITDEDDSVLALKWLARALPVHKQLRELPADIPGYERMLKRIFAGGARMCVAAHGPQVLGLALWRLIENTHDGLKLYVDDLVTDEAHRSMGVGQALSAHLEAKARELGCTVYALDSGTQRHRAHRFYLREGFSISAFVFGKMLKP